MIYIIIFLNLKITVWILFIIREIFFKSVLNFLKILFILGKILNINIIIIYLNNLLYIKIIHFLKKLNRLIIIILIRGLGNSTINSKFYN